MKIKSVHISNYKSYNAEGVTIPMSNITGFIGPNSAGKTNVLEALQLFFCPQKLTVAEFHKSRTDIPIQITVTFAEYISSSGTLCEKLFVNDGCFHLTRTYTWNEQKNIAEAEKEFSLAYAWVYDNENEILNPYKPKPSATAIKEYLFDSASKSFRRAIDWQSSTQHSEFPAKVECYWNTQKTSDSNWCSNFKWTQLDYNEELGKPQKEFLNIINPQLPNYLYLPINHSIDDEMSLKTGSRLESIFSSLLSLTEKQELRKNKAIEKIQLQIDKYYSTFYDKKLKTINRNLNSASVQWNFPETELELKREPQAIDSLLKPTWSLVADDGFSSGISNKGHGMQRLAVFQLLQSYVDYKVQTSKNQQIIIAIEEPELYLHPPYKRALYNLFRQLSSTFQIFYTTHDPNFVCLEYFDEIRLVRKNDFFESQVEHVDWSLFDNNTTWKNIFGKKRAKEARRNELQNKCHGEQNEGFFAKKIILVEGDTEKYALPQYFQKMGFDLDKENISLIEVQGVDALLPTYAIYAAFKIPVYVIFDGDKPSKNKYELYRQIVANNKNRYITFIKSLEKYFDDTSDSTLKELRNNANKISHIIPPEVLKQINSSDCSVKLLKFLYENSLISVDKLESIIKKNQRNINLQNLFHFENAKGFCSTILSPTFTMWEYNFEENVSKKLINFDELSKYANQICSGKPLIAKVIAHNAERKKFGEELESTLLELIQHIKNLESINTTVIETDITIEQTNPYIIRLFTPSSEVTIENGEKNVYACAGGPFNPEADPPIYYATGVVPEDTSYIIKISGDSMEPEIPDESFVAVTNKQLEPQNNKICVFCYNGNSICKQYTKGKDGVIRLISFNSKTDPIVIEEKEEGQLIYRGTVICGRDKKPIFLQVEQV